MNESPISVKIRIDWSEIDLFGHINNLAIQKYIQSSRVNYLELLGLMQSKAEFQIGPILASTSCQFRKPLFYPGIVTVFSKIVLVKKTSFHFHHQVMNDKDELIADAEDIVVFYDFTKETKVVIPDEVREKIYTIEGNLSHS